MVKQPLERILALDFGEKRIGVAVSDPGGTIAKPLCVLRRKNRDTDIKAISELVREQEAGRLVLGLPRKSASELGPLAERVLRLGKRLQRVLELPITYVDEFETTAEAEQALIAADMSRQRRRQVVDMLAASLILRRYLDGQGQEQPTPTHRNSSDGDKTA
ncbi:MAG: Holliday junction resolvase RuvX [Desulfarculaceae bacterium]|jgi:putative Holliday junction resolvase